MITEDDWTRLARYVAGESNPAEAAELRRWIEADPERAEALAFMRDVDGAAETGRPGWDTSAAWARLAARRGARARRPILLRYIDAPARRPLWRHPALRVAAVVLLAVGSFFTWRATRIPDLAPTAPVQVAVREYVTARGERATFQLPDGSLVILGVASRLRVPTTFGESGRRDLYLEGAAFFEVEHDEERPFLVHIANGIAEDLGTKFTVHEYPGDTTVQVVVAEGRVELRPAGDAPSPRGALLRAGQLGRLARNGDALVRSDVDIERYLSWTEGRLTFEDTPLRDALPELSRWYDLDFTLADRTLGERRLTGTFAAEAITETLELLAASLDVDYERRGRTITLLPRRG